eukprot:scaffold14856_cov35-Prasinocladus_malaysianus.AAC.1
MQGVATESRGRLWYGLGCSAGNSFQPIDTDSICPEDFRAAAASGQPIVGLTLHQWGNVALDTQTKAGYCTSSAPCDLQIKLADENGAKRLLPGVTYTVLAVADDFTAEGTQEWPEEWKPDPQCRPEAEYMSTASDMCYQLRWPTLQRNVLSLTVTVPPDEGPSLGWRANPHNFAPYRCNDMFISIKCDESRLDFTVQLTSSGSIDWAVWETGVLEAEAGSGYEPEVADLLGCPKAGPLAVGRVACGFEEVECIACGLESDGQLLCCSAGSGTSVLKSVRGLAE